MKMMFLFEKVEVAGTLDRVKNIARVGCHNGVKKLMIVLIREISFCLFLQNMKRAFYV
jgi:hypothetical protein